MALIRECKGKDFEGIWKLLGQLWPDKVMVEEEMREVFLRALDFEFHSHICATHEEIIVGFCSLSIKYCLWGEGYIGHLDEIIVDEKYREKGIGSELVREILRVAKDNGCGKVELDSAFHRKEAHEFYKRMGFEDIAFTFAKDI